MIKDTKKTELICLDCGYVQAIQRTKNHLKKEEHIKTLYCPSCNIDKRFIEIKDKDIYYAKLQHKTNLTELEQLILDLLSKGNELNGKRNIR